MRVKTDLKAMVSVGEAVSFESEISLASDAV